MDEQAAKRALGFVERVIAATGPRLPGTEACRQAGGLVRDAAATVCDEARLEPFPVHPGAFLGFIRVLVVLYALATAALAVLPAAAPVLATLAIVILVGENFLYREPLDPFFPRKEGLNVLATLEPAGPVDRQILVSGHHDSAHVFNFFVDRPELYSRRLYGGMGSLAALWIASFPLAFAPLAVRLVGAGLFVLAFALVRPLWRFAAPQGAPGAGDNLAAVAVALEIARHFRARRDAGAPLRRTRLVFASFDAEEAGLRGARAYARAHRADFAQVPTFGYNMDCLYKASKLSFLTSDRNGTVALDADLARECVAIAQAEGYAATARPIVFLTGGTDAAELAAAGVRQASLMGMDWSNEAREPGYHTPADTVDAIEPAVVRAAIRIGVRLVERLEAAPDAASAFTEAGRARAA